MIRGIGTDIVDIKRISQVVERSGDRFAQKILNAKEFQRYQSYHNPVAFLAKRFAAKEAAAKALGTGIGKVAWHDLDVSNDAEGAPIMRTTGTAKGRMEQLGATSIHLSLSDEKEYAVAFVVLEG